MLANTVLKNQPSGWKYGAKLNDCISAIKRT